MAIGLVTGAAGLGIVSMAGGSGALNNVNLGPLAAITASDGVEHGEHGDKEQVRTDPPRRDASKPADPSLPNAVTSVATPVPCDPYGLVAALVRANAEGGGDLNLAAGCTYTLATPDQGDAQSGLPIIQHPITIIGAGATIARDNDAAPFRFFTVRGGGELKLVDLNLTNGRAASGGSIQVDHDGTATVERVTITESTALAPDGGGGAIFNDGHLTVVDSTFHANRAAGATGKGGALLNGGVLTVAGSEFTNNTAGGSGGGFANFQGAADVATSTFINNNATEGGGIASVNARSKVWDTALTGNTAKVGGGIVNREAVITLRKMTIRQNISTANGGGIATIQGLVAADDSFVEENTGRGNGAGIFAETSTLLVRRTEVNRNSGVGPQSKGAGIHAEKGQITMFKSRVAENGATQKPGGFFVKDAQSKIDNVTVIAKNGPVNCGKAVENCFG
ncbi:membrane protein [Micromonospora polyrhachis]|uniref:Polymorphic outer membrane protein repeat-containing protein n=1 Tax=Micromonospora polyrhachis TaxID=1282883 RepID=A0A7W7SVJ7_9ACTN|nr:hypothetical protein [Micromonospora polyrhachis]MBB4961719.1 hypothetical protein [Micromonospora polyrhachis]